MSDPVFATKWDFLLGWVLVGVDRSTGVLSGSEPTPGQEMVAVWTDTALASEALHLESWELRAIKVRDLLRLIPDSVGVLVDPERSSGMTVEASYAAGLKRYVDAFPPDSTVRLGPWELPDGVRSALVAAATATSVRELRAFAYAVDDSPLLGCVTYVAAPGTTDTSVVTRAIDDALSASTDPGALGLPTVNIVGHASLPDEVRRAVGDEHLVHRAARPRFWRR